MQKKFAQFKNLYYISSRIYAEAVFAAEGVGSLHIDGVY